MATVDTMQTNANMYSGSAVRKRCVDAWICIAISLLVSLLACTIANAAGFALVDVVFR